MGVALGLLFLALRCPPLSRTRAAHDDHRGRWLSVTLTSRALRNRLDGPSLGAQSLDDILTVQPWGRRSSPWIGFLGQRFNALIDPADRRAQYVCLRSVV